MDPTSPECGLTHPLVTVTGSLADAGSAEILGRAGWLGPCCLGPTRWACVDGGSLAFSVKGWGASSALAISSPRSRVDHPLIPDLLGLEPPMRPQGDSRGPSVLCRVPGWGLAG